MSRVFVVQEPTRFNKETGRREVIMNLRPAAEYGDLEFLIDPGKYFMLAPGPIIKEMKRKLFNFNDNDFLVPVGDPSAIACAAMIAGLANAGKVNFLKWDGKLRKYIKVEIDVGVEI